MRPPIQAAICAQRASQAKQPQRLPPRPAPALRFSPRAFAKLVFLRDLGETEVGGFAITAADDLLLVEDVRLVGQASSPASVAFDDEAVADFFDAMVDQGLRPEQFARIWVHTHPGNWPDPSSTDLETFERVFGRTQWAVMFVLARGGQTHATLRFGVGPGGEMPIPVSVDYGRPFAASDHEAWRAEYLACVEPLEPFLVEPRPSLFNRERQKSLLVEDFLSPDEEHWLDGWSILEDEEPLAEEVLDVAQQQ